MTFERTMLRMNHGNSLRFMGQFAEAIEEYQKAIAEIRQLRDAGLAQEEGFVFGPVDRINQALGQILILLAEVYGELGSYREVESCLQEAETLYSSKEVSLISDFSQNDNLEFYAKTHWLYDKIGQTEKALENVNKAVDLLEKRISRQTGLSEWESLLGHWVRIHGARIRYLLDLSPPQATRQALITAESTKGRILHWGFGGLSSDAAESALGEQRQAEALDQVLNWCKTGKKKRLVISFFADFDGLALFVISEMGYIKASWDKQYAFLSWLKYRMNPFDLAVRQHNASLLSAVVNGMLLELGNSLWRLYPELAQGGDELVILPHKAFRNIPLQYTEMPNGKTLGELFARVIIYPTLWEFSTQVQRKNTIQTSVMRAFVDPDGSLPFARLEGWLCCDKDWLASGGEASKQHLWQACLDADILLISSHGVFNARDPWRSAIKLADGWAMVEEFARQPSLPQVIVFGACETGLNRRTAIDEPIGFSGILLRRGVKAVIAPLWPVDDFASSLFMTAFFRELRDGNDIARSLMSASFSLRDTTATIAIDKANEWMRAIDCQANTLLDVPVLTAKLRSSIAWLSKQKADSRPFASPIDWAAYQLVGS